MFLIMIKKFMITSNKKEKKTIKHSQNGQTLLIRSMKWIMILKKIGIY